MSEKRLLEMKQIRKEFPGVVALDNVDFCLGYGEVHALMGENGAGKSTLIKVLTGIYKKGFGTIIFDGEEHEFSNALEAQDVGISTIYQELNLIPYVSVAENIFLGREPKKRGIIDWKKINADAAEILKKMGVNIDVTKPLNSYGTALQQMVAIARAISIKAKIVVMDEPTSSLDENEVKVLFDLIRQLKKDNVSVIFITHRLDEIYEVCDKVTILKDGKLVGEYLTKELNKLDLVSKMVGRDAKSIIGKKHEGFYKADAGMILEAKDIYSSVKLHGMNVDIGKGEIVGLAGLLGSGRTELARVAFGDDTQYQGEVKVDGKTTKFKLPKDAIVKGFALCSEDRKVEGIFPNMTVRENLTMAKLSNISKAGVVNNKKQNEIVTQYIDSLSIKTPGPEQLIKNLSGGNQQKVILARWLCMDPRLVILDEPTRGIDVGAKAEIEEIIQDMSKRGISVLMISSELEELVRNCHRIIVVREGRDVGQLGGDDVSEKNIMHMIAHESGPFSGSKEVN